MDETHKKIYDIYKRMNDTMECSLCNQTMKFTSSKLHFSTIKNHLLNKHYDVYRQVCDIDENPCKVTKLDSWVIKCDTEALPVGIAFIDRQTIAAVASRHILPFNIVEDPIFSWAYPHQVKDRHIIAQRISELASDWRKQIGTKLNCKFLSISLDGWTNNVSHKLHFCLMIHDGPKVYFWSSQVMLEMDHQAFKVLVESVINEIQTFGGIVTSLVADNARNVQLALKSISKEKKGILQVRCIAHIINLMQGDVFRRVNLAKQSLNSAVNSK